MSTILCIDAEPAVGASLETALTGLGHRPVIAASVEQGMAAVAIELPDLIISDYRMPEATGLDLIDQLRRGGLDIPVIIMTGFSSIEPAVHTVRHGAVDYLTKPLRAEALRIAVTHALEVSRLRRENEDFRRELRTLRGERAIVGASQALRAVLDTVGTVAPTAATVLVQGESGTGKELIARAIHDGSPRREQPFVTVNCAALPEGLVESALFGHEPGAFTGATARGQGAFERAHRGTLLLDEISEMRLALQPRLLRAIHEQEIERVGGDRPIRVDVRIVATTNRDLKSEVDAGRFRADLFHRLHAVPIHAPPLRDRLSDLPMLVEHFVAAAAARLGVRPPRVDRDAIDTLTRRAWPGNVRELANVVERAVILSRTGTLTPDSFAGTGAPTAPGAPAVADMPLDLGELERIAIQRALQATGGRRARAAGLLGISERTLRNKLNSPPSAGA